MCPGRSYIIIIVVLLTDLHDFIIPKLLILVFNTAKLATLDPTKPHPPEGECIPDSYVLNPFKLTDEKLRQLMEQHDWYIKADVEGYVQPSFLSVEEHSSSTSHISSSCRILLASRSIAVHCVMVQRSHSIRKKNVIQLKIILLR